MNKKVSLVVCGTAISALILTACGTQPASNQSGSANNSTTQQNTSQSTGSLKTDVNKDITIGYINWSEDIAATYLWKHLLEQRGYSVKLKSVALGPMWIGLSTGGVDLFYDAWMPEQNKYEKKFQGSVGTIGHWYTGQTLEGFVVPKYMTNVNSIRDLNKVNSKLQGDIVGIGEGAVEMDLAKKAVQQYGLHETLESSSAPAMLTALKKAYSNHKDVVVTLWSPHWAFAKYKLKYLKDPKGVFGKPGWIQGEVNNKWVASHPQAMQWLKNFKINQQQLGSLEEDINNSKSKDAAVTKWIAANQGLVDSWFK